MSSTKFKNVKWDNKKNFKKEIAKFNLSSEAFNLIELTSVKNPIVVTFNSLLREKNLDYRQETNTTNLIKLYAALQVAEALDQKDKEAIINSIKNAIDKLSKKVKVDEFKATNFEAEFLKGYSVSDSEKMKYFSYDEYYKNVAALFATPFKEQIYYDFAYQLVMYINLELVFNEYVTPENTDIFLIKLEVQQKMIDTLTHISNEGFNVVLINLNKWFKKYNKKFIKLSRRKMEE